MFFITIIMKVLATIQKTTDGRVSTWRFCEVDDTFFALRGNNKVVSCKDKEDMRRLYKRMTSKKQYGFMPVSA